jgi:hypothetical protein
MASWHHGIMASWHHGIMASWHHGIMASWHDGIMASFRGCLHAETWKDCLHLSWIIMKDPFDCLVEVCSRIVWTECQLAGQEKPFSVLWLDLANRWPHRFSYGWTSILHLKGRFLHNQHAFFLIKQSFLCP